MLKNQKLKKLMKLVIIDEENFTSSEQLEESQWNFQENCVLDNINPLMHNVPKWSNTI